MAEGQDYDVVIVGSGFGGSVLAYRLAEAGLKVCVLERGKSYPPNSFPRSPVDIRNNFWDPSNGLFGLNNVWSFKGSAGLVASGLGGGSLIYANVLIRKDERWFDASWPIHYSDLVPHYERVEKMMNVQRYPLHLYPYDQTNKTIAMEHAAKCLGHKTIPLNLAISFRSKPVTDPAHPDDAANPPVVGGPIYEPNPNLHKMPRSTCRLCGECDIGCNYGSKNTLDFNYLTRAQQCGADIKPLCEVLTFAQLGGKGYEVTYREHDPISSEGKRLNKRQKLARSTATIRCGRLILAAGTMGSTFLLMNNRSKFPNLSPALGTRFSTNGDDLAFFLEAKKKLRPEFGPVITTAIRYPDSLDGEGEVGRGFYVEDGGNPYLLSWMVEISGVLGFLRRFLRFVWYSVRYWLGLARMPDLGYRFAKLLGSCRTSSHAMPVLVMGRDIPSGKFSLKDGVLDCDWTVKASARYHDRVARELGKIAEAIGARYDENPLFRFDFQKVLTAHPLGGCPMGKNQEEGVVNQWGEVFGYPGLYVADGSTMPGPVGPNPSLTIAAFADRVADGIINQARPAP